MPEQSEQSEKSLVGGHEVTFERAIALGEVTAIAYGMLCALFTLIALKMVTTDPPGQHDLCCAATLRVSEGSNVIHACNVMYKTVFVAKFGLATPFWVAAVWCLGAFMLVGAQSRMRALGNYRRFTVLTVTFGGIAACLMWLPGVSCFLTAATFGVSDHLISAALFAIHQGVPKEGAGATGAAIKAWHTAYEGYNAYDDIVGCIEKGAILYFMFEFVAVVDVIRIVIGRTCFVPDFSNETVHPKNEDGTFQNKVHFVAGIRHIVALVRRRCDKNFLKVNPAESRAGRAILGGKANKNQPLLA